MSPGSRSADGAKEKCSDQDGDGEGKNSDGIHWGDSSGDLATSSGLRTNETIAGPGTHVGSVTVEIP
jgi:hypothetical protein